MDAAQSQSSLTFILVPVLSIAIVIFITAIIISVVVVSCMHGEGGEGIQRSDAGEDSDSDYYLP